MSKEVNPPSPGSITRFRIIPNPPPSAEASMGIVNLDNYLGMINEIPDSDPPDPEGLRSFLLSAVQTAFPLIKNDVMGPREIAKLTALVFDFETDRNFDRYILNCIRSPYTPGKMLIESAKSRLLPSYGYDRSRLLALWAFFKVSNGIILHMNNTETPVKEGATRTINRLGNSRLAGLFREKDDKTPDNEAELDNEAGLERMTWQDCDDLYNWLQRLLMTTEKTEQFSAQRLNGAKPPLANLLEFTTDLYRNLSVLFPEEYKVKSDYEGFSFGDVLLTWGKFLTYHAENPKLSPDLLYKKIKKMVTSIKPPDIENSDELDWYIRGLKRMEERKKRNGVKV